MKIIVASFKANRTSRYGGECGGQTEPALQRFAGNSAACTADFFEQELRPGVRELLSSSRSCSDIL